MSQLVTIAERIKVITNIQKTARAMQLISMSTLSRVGNKKKALQLYAHQLEKLTQELVKKTQTSPDTNDYNKDHRTLYLIIGSQKGFCGAFNITLFNFIKELQKRDNSFPCIAIGTYAYDFCKKQGISLLENTISYSLANIEEITEIVFNKIMMLKDSFDSITVISNYNASIFLQRPQKTIIPLVRAQETTTSSTLIYATEQPLHEIFDHIGNLRLKTQVFQLLMESLRAENSARALSMDNSTRNAENLLSEMKLIYNKLRQAKVTKELTELSSSLTN